MKTVGELKKFLEELDDDMPVLKTSGNFEMKGAIVNGFYATTGKYTTTTKTFYDSFDYEEYESEVYEPDKNEGVECLYVW